MSAISTKKNSETALLWFIKVLAGGMIFVFLVIHFFVNHIFAPEGLLTFRDVVAYYQNPLVLVMEGLFLFSILVHSFLGLRSVILDLNPGPRLIRIMDTVLITGGVSGFVYGIWLLNAVAAMHV